MRNGQEFIIKTKTGVWQTLIWLDKKDKVYIAKTKHLPGVVTFGKTINEAKRMAKDAIELYCECEIEDGKILIDDERRVVGKLPPARVLSLA